MISGLALDIDDTLAHTGHDRFHEMRELFGDPGFPFEDLHKYHDLASDTWMSDEANQRKMQKVHENEYYKNISLVPWAHETVGHIHSQIPFSCYITMRPQDVLQWTEERLTKHGFPQLPIIARPISLPRDDRHQWKASTLYELYQEWVTGIIDDQIKIIHQMETYHPDYQGIIHIVRPMAVVESAIRHTVSNSWQELREKLWEWR